MIFFQLCLSVCNVKAAKSKTNKHKNIKIDVNVAGQE